MKHDTLPEGTRWFLCEFHEDGKSINSVALGEKGLGPGGKSVPRALM